MQIKFLSIAEQVQETSTVHRFSALMIVQTSQSYIYTHEWPYNLSCASFCLTIQQFLPERRIA